MIRNDPETIRCTRHRRPQYARVTKPNFDAVICLTCADEHWRSNWRDGASVEGSPDSSAEPENRT